MDQTGSEGKNALTPGKAFLQSMLATLDKMDKEAAEAEAQRQAARKRLGLQVVRHLMGAAAGRTSTPPTSTDKLLPSHLNTQPSIQMPLASSSPSSIVSPTRPTAAPITASIYDSRPPPSRSSLSGVCAESPSSTSSSKLGIVSSSPISLLPAGLPRRPSSGPAVSAPVLTPPQLAGDHRPSSPTGSLLSNYSYSSASSMRRKRWGEKRNTDDVQPQSQPQPQPQRQPQSDSERGLATEAPQGNSNSHLSPASHIPSQTISTPPSTTLPSSESPVSVNPAVVSTPSLPSELSSLATVLTALGNTDKKVLQKITELLLNQQQSSNQENANSTAADTQGHTNSGMKDQSKETGKSLAQDGDGERRHGGLPEGKDNGHNTSSNDGKNSDNGRENIAVDVVKPPKRGGEIVNLDITFSNKTIRNNININNNNNNIINNKNNLNNGGRMTNDSTNSVNNGNSPSSNSHAKGLKRRQGSVLVKDNKNDGTPEDMNNNSNLHHNGLNAAQLASLESSVSNSGDMNNGGGSKSHSHNIPPSILPKRSESRQGGRKQQAQSPTSANPLPNSVGNERLQQQQQQQIPVGAATSTLLGVNDDMNGNDQGIHHLGSSSSTASSSSSSSPSSSHQVMAQRRIEWLQKQRAKQQEDREARRAQLVEAEALKNDEKMVVNHLLQLKEEGRNRRAKSSGGGGGGSGNDSNVCGDEKDDKQMDGGVGSTPVRLNSHSQSSSPTSLNDEHHKVGVTPTSSSSSDVDGSAVQTDVAGNRLGSAGLGGPNSNGSSGNTGGGSAMSNKKRIQNALTYVCLAGTAYDTVRKDVLAELIASPGTHFVIAFKHNSSYKFSALYLAHISSGSSGSAVKLYGEGPAVLNGSDVEGYFKYDSAGKQWKKLHNTGITPTTDAVQLMPRKKLQNAASSSASAPPLLPASEASPPASIATST